MVNFILYFIFIEPLSVLNFNGYQVEPGAIINTFIASPSDSNSGSDSGSGSGINPAIKELTLTCSTLSSNDRVQWMVINFSNYDSFTVNRTTVNNSLSNLTVRIYEGELTLTVACISEEYNELINITVTTGMYICRYLSMS